MPTGNLKRYRATSAGVFLIAAACVLGRCMPAAAQSPDGRPTGYRMPPKAIADLVDAPPTPRVGLGPDRRWMILMALPSLPSITEVAQPELRLAGIRLNPRTNGPSRSAYYTGLTLLDTEDGTEQAVTGLPEDPRIRDVSWAPDGTWISFSLTREDGIELWAAPVPGGAARRLTGPSLNSALSGAVHWLPDSRSLITRLVPEDREAPPPAPTVPRGPVVRSSSGRKAPARTYQDLLQNAHDEDLFAHFLTARIARVSIEGRVESLGAPDLIVESAPSPDGNHLLVITLHRPFSYLVPMYRFPRRVEIWDLEGRRVRQVADLPLAEEVPIGFSAVPEGPRSFGWRSDAPATLYWAEAQDGGDPKREAEIRDRLFTLAAPFDGEPEVLASLGLRFNGMTWGRPDLALLTEHWWSTRRIRTWIVRPADPGRGPELLFDRTWEDRYSDPGSPLTEQTPRGTSVLRFGDGGNALYFAGRGYSPEGSYPFLDRLDLATKATRRLWRCEAPYYESVVDLLDRSEDRILTRRESVREPPNYFIRNLDGNRLRQITRFPHPAPRLRDVQKELIRYEREDGVALSATLYLPAGYDAERDGPLPMLMWAYPREFKSADAAGQLSSSPHQFIRVGWSSTLLWLTQGFAVLDGPTLPIVGEGEEEPNDTYVEQLVAGARAAKETVVRMGVADPDRMAIGGHSYGAFMTAHLLAHSDLFKAGIARSGAYNRTLTPFGFQSEERTLWEAPELYFRMSPFMHAHKVNEPILLIHGEADNNSGTFPMQSERYYNALMGHGAVTRLVMLPHESHGYRARESVMHMLWEMSEWLERYVKGSGEEE